MAQQHLQWAPPPQYQACRDHQADSHRLHQEQRTERAATAMLVMEEEEWHPRRNWAGCLQEECLS